MGRIKMNYLNIFRKLNLNTVHLNLIIIDVYSYKHLINLLIVKNFIYNQQQSGIIPKQFSKANINKLINQLSLLINSHYHSFNK
jgi:hypothetical protein